MMQAICLERARECNNVGSFYKMEKYSCMFSDWKGSSLVKKPYSLLSNILQNTPATSFRR